jgi:hypothetical protein
MRFKLISLDLNMIIDGCRLKKCRGKGLERASTGSSYVDMQTGGFLVIGPATQWWDAIHKNANTKTRHSRITLNIVGLKRMAAQIL